MKKLLTQARAYMHTYAYVHVLAVVSSVGAGLLIMLTGMFTIALIRTARVVIIVVKLMWCVTAAATA